MSFELSQFIFQSVRVNSVKLNPIEVTLASHIPYKCLKRFLLLVVNDEYLRLPTAPF